MSGILVVDDSRDNREPLVRLLKRAGHEVHSAEDGIDALEKIAQFPPDLIVLDVMMPRMGGLEFLQELRRDPAYQNTPVILVTAANDKNVLGQFGALGVKNCLLKSQFTFPELLKCVSDELGDRREHLAS